MTKPLVLVPSYTVLSLIARLAHARDLLADYCHLRKLFPVGLSCGKSAETYMILTLKHARIETTGLVSIPCLLVSHS